MRNTQLKRTLQVMRRTGDKAIVMDTESDEVFVLMNLDNYEGMLDTLDYNAPEPTNDDDDESDDAFVLDDLLGADGAETPTDETSAEPETRTTPIPESAPPTSALDFAPDWVAPKGSPIVSEESLADVPSDEEEEKFYLEPVE